MTLPSERVVHLIFCACRAAEELGTPVFPVRVHPYPNLPGKMLKTPLVRRWQNGGAVTHPEAIESLFRQHPNATHVGLQTGLSSRLVVIDLDGEPGQRWRRGHADMLPATRTQRTQREGGLHLLYRLPAGVELRNSAGKIAPGVDIRASGGFVVDWSSDYPPSTDEVSDAPPELVVYLIEATAKAERTTGSGGDHRAGDQDGDHDGDHHVGEGGRNDFLSHEAYRLRKSGSTIEQIYIVLSAMNKARCKPPLPDAEVRQIAAGKAGVTTDEDDDLPWTTEPVNFLGEFIPAPLSTDEVPQEIGAYASLYCGKTGFDLTIALAMVVGACAAAITDEIQICADSSTAWFEQARLWTLVIAPPGEGKTPVFKEAIKPLRDLHHELTEQWKKAYAQWEKDCAATPPDQEKPPEPPRPRVVVDDATLEKLSDVLVDNPRGVLVATDEFSTWLGSLDHYRNTGGMDRDRGEWLRLFEGGPHQIERVKRGTVYVKNWSASIITATTPAALKKLAKHLPEDGLIQRFIPFIPRDREDGDNTIPGIDIEAARTRYAYTVRRLFALRPVAHSGVLQLSLAARERFTAWNKDMTKLLRAARDYAPALAGHFAKYPTFCLRLALTFHCARIVQLADERLIDPAAYPVPVETLDMAVRFLRRAQQHAIALYLSRFGSEAYTLAQDIARFVLARGDENEGGLQRRDLLRHVHGFKAAEGWTQHAALIVLMDAGWLRVDDTAGYNKPHATRFRVNPHLNTCFARTATKVREHRAAMRAAINEAAEDRRREKAGERASDAP